MNKIILEEELKYGVMMGPTRDKPESATMHIIINVCKNSGLVPLQPILGCLGNSGLVPLQPILGCLGISGLCGGKWAGPGSGKHKYA